MFHHSHTTTTESYSEICIHKPSSRGYHPGKPKVSTKSRRSRQDAVNIPPSTNATNNPKPGGIDSGRTMSLPRILVTGGSGFLGSEIVKQLVETKQYSVTVMDINPPSMGTETFPSVHYVRANVLKPEELQKVFQETKPTIVIHTVGIYDVGDARYTSKNEKIVFEVNVQGTRNVVEAAKECRANGLVYTSSFTVLVDEIEADFRNADETWPTGRATLAYGKSKVVEISFAVPFTPRTTSLLGTFTY